MAVVINGTTGITSVNGSAAAPSVTGADTDTGIVYGTNTLSLATGGTTAVTVDSSQNVGIGTSSPSAKLHVLSTTLPQVKIDYNGTYYTTISNNGTFNVVDPGTDNKWVFNRNGTTQAIIDTSGNLLVGTTSTLGASGAGNTHIAGSNSQPLYLRNTAATAGKYWRVGPDSSSNTFTVYNQGNATGVYLTDGGTSWTGVSDERLKTTLTPFENAAEKVCTLRTGTGRYLTDDESVSRSFLIAQDVQKVLPEAVNVQSNEQGTLGLQYTDVIPLLVAAIQEQQALITQLQADVAALKAPQ